MMFRTGRPCAAGRPHWVAPTVLSQFMLFRGGWMVSAPIRFRAGDHAGSPLRVCVVFNVDSCGRPRGVAPTVSYCFLCCFAEGGCHLPRYGFVRATTWGRPGGIIAIYVVSRRVDGIRPDTVSCGRPHGVAHTISYCFLCCFAEGGCHRPQRFCAGDHMGSPLMNDSEVDLGYYSFITLKHCVILPCESSTRTK